MICERMRWVPIQKLLCNLSDEPGWTYPDKILLSWHSYNVVTIYAVWMKNSCFNAFYEKWFLVCYLELLLYCSTLSVTKVFWFNKICELQCVQLIVLYFIDFYNYCFCGLQNSLTLWPKVSCNTYTIYFKLFKSITDGTYCRKIYKLQFNSSIQVLILY